MNTFGRLFRISIFGESHGPLTGISIDGCPAGIPLSVQDFDADISRRKPGAAGTTPRTEADTPQLVSGVFNGHTTGAPLTIVFANTNTRSGDYEEIRRIPRPGHADFVLHEKFSGFNDHRGGGHSSGRLTLCIVAAGVIARKILGSRIQIHAALTEAGGDTDITAAIDRAVQDQDSIGGIITCGVQGLPAGLGEPFFDAAESQISHIIFAVPAVKGIEFGSGFEAARMKGSLHNDPILDETGRTATNHAGGINGGITNGNELTFRVAIKPASSTPQLQHSYSRETGNTESFRIKGRHDLCIALRAPVVIEAAAAIALADMLLIQKGQS